MNDKVLFVDDEPNILEAYQRTLQKVLHVDTAEGGMEGLKRVAERGPYAVVIADMQMPMMNGIEFLARVKDQAPDTVRMMLTGKADVRTATDAVNEGNIFRFLTKPCPAEVLAKALVAGINQYRLVTTEKTLLEDTLNGSIELLVEILSWADPDAFGQALQLRGSARAVARMLELSNLWEIELAALLSRIGHIVLPRDLAAKARGGEVLDENAKQALLRAPEVGHELLSRIPRLESVARIILYQNKCFNGSGFPEDPIAGSDIPAGSQILKVLNDLSELKLQGFPKRDAFAIMQSRTGWYDSRVLDAATALYAGSDGSARIGTSTAAERRISDLQMGDILLSNVETLDDRLLIKAGEVVTEPLLVRLRVYAKLVGIREPVKVKRSES